MTAVAVVRSETTLPFQVGVIAWHPSNQWLAAGASRLSGAHSPVGGLARVDAATGLVRWHLPGEHLVTSMAVRADGRLAAALQSSSESAGRVKVLAGATGGTLFDAAGLGEVRYSPDGRFLVHENSSARTVLVDAATGQLVRDVGDGVAMAAFSSDSATLAVAEGSRLLLWDLTTGTLLATTPLTAMPMDMSFRDAGDRLVLCRGAKTTVVDGRTGTVVATTTLDLPLQVLDSIRPRRISPDGHVIAALVARGVVGCRVDDGQRLFFSEFGTGDFRFTGPLEFSPTGDHVAIDRGFGVAPDQPRHGVAVLDTRNGAVLWQDVRDDVSAVAHSPDGTQLAAAGRGASGNGFVRIYHARQLELSRRRVRGRVFHVAAGAGRIAAADDASTATTVDCVTGAVLAQRSHTGKLTAIAMSDDGRHVVTGSTARLVHLFTADKGVPVWAARLGGAVNGVAIGGERIAVAGADRTTRLYPRDAGADPEQQSPLWTATHPQPVTAVALGAHRVATACNDRVTRILDIRDGAELHRISHPNGKATGIAFSGDLLAVGVTDGTARVVDATTGATRLHVTHPSDIVAVAISADGALLATAGAEPAVRLWHVGGTGQPLRTLPQTGPVTALSFHPADRSLAIATEAGVVSIVDANGVPLGHSAHPAAVRHLVHSADGRVLATACDDEHVRAFTTIPL